MASDMGRERLLQRVNREARDLVAAELDRRGVKNIRETRDLNRTVLKGDSPDGQAMTFVIKSKTKGAWQGTITDGDPKRAQPEVVWVFVDLGAGPDYYVVPDHWVRKDIQEKHAAYLDRYGGRRAEGGASLHHSIHPSRIASWRDRWDLITARHFNAVPSYWAFLADPRLYDIERAVRILEVDRWTTRRSAVRAGDRVAIWRASSADGRRGVIALGEVLTDPEDVTDAENPFWLRPGLGVETEPRVLVRYVRKKELPLWVGDERAGVLEELSVFRARGGTVFRVTPEQWHALVTAAGGWESLSVGTPMPRETSKSRWQGYGLNPLERRAVELRAMALAKAHYRREWPDVQDVSATASCDLMCRGQGKTLYVEVKGTTGTGESIMLTRNEVELSEGEFPSTALFVVSGIALAQSDTEEVVAYGGTVREIRPWNAREMMLQPTAYRCQLLEAPSGAARGFNGAD